MTYVFSQRNAMRIYVMNMAVALSVPILMEIRLYVNVRRSTLRQSVIAVLGDTKTIPIVLM